MCQSPVVSEGHSENRRREKSSVAGAQREEERCYMMRLQGS